MKEFYQFDALTDPPTYSSWYHTDKGELFWFRIETLWSKSSMKIEEEYPKYWYLEKGPITL